MAAGNFFGGQFFGGGFFGAITTQAPPTGGGYIRYHPDYYKKSRERIRKERQALGIDVAALDVIEGVAKRQALGVESDSQKQLDELHRELQLAEIEWEGRYLEVLNDLRERYISEEIARLLDKKLKDEEDVMMLLVLAATI